MSPGSEARPLAGPRRLAHQVLLQVEGAATAHPDRLVRAVLSRHGGLSDRDRALVTDLVYGTLRRQGTLDWHIDLLSRVPPKKIAPAVRVALRMGLYQVLYLDRVPPFAAVNETVEIVRATQPAFVTGFANGLLREALRRHPGWPFPDEAKDPLGFLAVTESFPRWAVGVLSREMGPDEARAFLHASNVVAPLDVRVNTLKGTREAVAAWFSEAGCEVSPGPFAPASLRLRGLHQDIGATAPFRDGLIQVQDEASQLVSLLLSPKPGERVLDLCAGFGGKATHCGILMENRGEVVAVDDAAWKLADLSENAARQGVSICRTLSASALDLTPEAAGGPFDRVLVDAPCTGFGSLRRNPDIKWRRTVKDPHRSSRLQSDLLRHAARFVKMGGVLVYATCTVFREENEDVAQTFTKNHPEFAPVPAAPRLPDPSLATGPFMRAWPQRHETDGFFAALWRREGEEKDSEGIAGGHPS